MSGNLPSYRLITAACLLLAYLAIAGTLLWALYHPSPGGKPEWNEVLVIFNAIGALATTAVGVLLGVEIQQGTVNSAVRDSQRDAADAARKGTAIVAALGRLDAANGTAAATAADPNILAARAVLHTALAVPSSNQG
jgi:hypothetical protein